jgi:FkbM family methyltransferase
MTKGDAAGLTPGSLIFDVGFHNGDDSAYYLSRGHRVVAVEANPALAEAGCSRFASEITAGKLQLLNIGITSTSGAGLPFYVNESDSGWSSFVAEQGRRGGKYRTIQVEGRTILELFQEFGVPEYLKVDVEGADEMVLRSLTPEYAPSYLSSEMGFNSQAVNLLVDRGYTGFKLIDQTTFTQSLPVFDFEMGIRMMRKASRLLPPIGWLLSSLPDGVRPRKTEWDSFRQKFPHPFSNYSSGPFAEETEGRWQTADEMRQHLERVFCDYERSGLAASFWCDIHARHSRLGAVGK